MALCAMALLFGAAVAHAENITTSTSANVSTPAASVQAKLVTRQQAELPKIIAKSDTAIAARITALNNLSTRVSALKNVSAAEKANLAAQISTTINGLNSLKAKIDADTDVSVATTDMKSITGSYRIYALAIPQGYIAASADRINVIAGMLSTISVKLAARVTASQQATLDDMNAKIADANAKASLAVTATASLAPDQGDKDKMAANTAALKAARANTKLATADLEAARKDAKAIIAALPKASASGNAKVKASASAPAQQ